MPQVFQAHDALPVIDPLIVLYGTPGSGKTSLAFTTDDPEMWDVDLGVQRAVGRKRVVRFADYADILAYMAPGGEFEQQVPRPKTLVVDTAGALLDDFIADYVVKLEKRNGKPGGGGVSLQGFGAMKDVFAAFLRRCRQLGVLPVFICHSVEKQDGDNMRLRPKMTGGAYDVLVSKADLVGYVEMLDNRVTINFNPTSRQIGKNCVGFPVLTLPHHGAPEYQGYFQRLIDQTRARLAEMSEEQRAALELVKNLCDAVAGAADLPALDTVQQQVASLPGVYQAQVQGPINERWAAIWTEQRIEPARTLAEFDALIEAAKGFGPDVPKQVKVLLRKAMTAAAEQHGFVWDKLAGEAGAFVAKVPSEPATASDAQPAAEEAATTTEAPAGDADPTGGAAAAVEAAGTQGVPMQQQVPPLPSGAKLPGVHSVATPEAAAAKPARRASNAELSKP